MPLDFIMMYYLTNVLGLDIFFTMLAIGLFFTVSYAFFRVTH